MTLRAQISFEAGDTRQKIARLLRRLRAIRRDTTADPEKLNGLINEYTDLIERLGMPVFVGDRLDPRETATFQRLNRLFEAIGADVSALFSAQRGTATMLLRAYNRNQAILKGAEAELRNATAESLTAAIQGGVTQRGTFVYVDTFDDRSKVNTDVTTAELAVGGGALTLQKTEVFPVEHAKTKIEIEADRSTPSGATGVVIKPPYEGKYYAYLGEGEFEAGRLKLIPGPDGLLMAAPTEAEQLIRARRIIVDGSADTYHQIERSVVQAEGEIDPGQLDAAMPYDFVVTYVVDVGDVVSATAVVLDPINFADRAWIEVTNIETSIDKQNWAQIPGLHDHNYFNVLTDEANKVLHTEAVNSLLAPSKYQYSGKGLWLFGVRNFRYLRMTLKQKTPVAQPYEVIEVKQSRTVTTKKKPVSVGGISFGKGSTKTKNEDRVIQLSYEESLKMFSGDEILSQEFGSYKAEEGLQISILGHDLFSGGGKSVEKSAWKTSGVRAIVKNNIARYAIGIRELEILTANYAEASVYQSVPITTAVPIRQVLLKSDDRLSEGFPEGTWIKYYVSVDGGNNWGAIAPQDRPVQYDNGVRIPTVLQVNSGTPDDAKDERFGYLETGSDTNELLVRIELRRPPSDQGLTPIVTRYALEILTNQTPGLE